MAGYIKGITIEFGADTSKLNSALKKTQGTINKTQAELKQINKALKFNPGNTALLKQKFDLLKASVQQTEDKLKQLKTMQAQMNAAGVDKASAQYRQLEREIIKTENNLKMAEAELRRFGSIGKQQALAVGTAMKTAGGKIKSVGRSITTTMSVWGVAGIYAGSKMIDMYEDQAEAALKLEKVYKSNMGASKAAAQATMEYASALQKQGVIGDEVTIAGAAVLAQYSDTPEAINAILPAMDNYLAKTKGVNATQEDAEAAAKIFGKALNGNYTTLERNGIVLTDNQKKMLETASAEEKAAILADIVAQKTGNMNSELANTDAGKIQQAKNELGDMGEEIGAVLLPAVADLVTWFRDNLMPHIQNFISFMQQHPAIATFALALAGITAVIGPLIMGIGGLVGAIGTLTTAGVTMEVSLAPIIGIIAAVIAAIAACIAIGVLLYKNWDKIKAKASQIFASVKSTFSKFKQAIAKPFQDAWTTIKKIWDKLKGLFPLKIGKIFSNLKIPKIKIEGGKAPYGIGGFGKKPKISVSWNKKAMENPYMFSNATLFGAGEAGDEILYGRNRLMKDIANAVSGNGGGDIIMNVYGSEGMSVTELASAVEQKLIQAQKRRTQAWA